MNKIESKKRNTREWRTNEIFKNKARKKEREKTGVKKEEEIKQEKKKGRKKGKIYEIYKLEEEEKKRKKVKRWKRGETKKRYRSRSGCCRSCWSTGPLRECGVERWIQQHVSGCHIHPEGIVALHKCGPEKKKNNRRRDTVPTHWTL